MVKKNSFLFLWAPDGICAWVSFRSLITSSKQLTYVNIEFLYEILPE